MNLREVKVRVLKKKKTLASYAHYKKKPQTILISNTHSWGLIEWNNCCCSLSAVTTVTEEAQPRQRGETEGGDPRERSPLLRL